MPSGSKINKAKLNIRILQPLDVLNGFCCKKEDINEFIHKEAKSFQNKRLGTSYLCLYEKKLIGFVTLSMADLKRERMEDEDQLPIDIENYPALQIGQLAVCSELEGNKIGTELCNFSLGKAYEFSEKVGCRFLVLNAERSAIGFYEKYGFKLLPDQERRRQPIMFINIFDKEHVESALPEEKRKFGQLVRSFVRVLNDFLKT